MQAGNDPPPLTTNQTKQEGGGLAEGLTFPAPSPGKPRPCSRAAAVSSPADMGTFLSRRAVRAAALKMSLSGFASMSVLMCSAECTGEFFRLIRRLVLVEMPVHVSLGWQLRLCFRVPADSHLMLAWAE